MVFFFLFFVIFERNFDKYFYHTDHLLCLLVRKVCKHRKRLHLIYGEVVVSGYIGLAYIFHRELFER